MGSFINITIGIFTFFIGIFLYTHWAELCMQIRGKTMALSVKSTAFESWKRLPFPIYLDVYLFNWTNADEFHLDPTIKPHFVELGPYRFHETTDKVDIVWNEHNHTVSYRKKALFVFDPDNSNGTLDDKVTSVNTVAHAAALKVKTESLIHKIILERTLRMYDEEMMITKTAREWLFAGYADPLVTMSNLMSVFTKVDVPFDRVGWMYMRNNSASYDGHFNMFTGTDDIKKMGQVHSWNYQEQSNAFDGDCGHIHGSAGEFFPPNLHKHKFIWLYVPNICRAVPLDYVDTITIHGVKAYKFSGTLHAVDNGTWYPENKCLCTIDNCEYSGVFSISRCKYNSSIYMSYPHFYKADTKYLAEVDGLQPDQNKHELSFAIEPNTGLPMKVSGGFQANYMLEPIAGVRPFHNIRKILIPLMWAEERVTISKSIAQDIAIVPMTVLFGQIIGITLVLLGSVLLSWQILKFAMSQYRLGKWSINEANVEMIETISNSKETSIKSIVKDDKKYHHSLPLSVMGISENSSLLNKNTNNNFSNG